MNSMTDALTVSDSRNRYLINLRFRTLHTGQYCFLCNAITKPYTVSAKQKRKQLHLGFLLLQVSHFPLFVLELNVELDKRVLFERGDLVLPRK